ncbi:hypothetical protein ACHAXS_003524, partial [Conticribra weissflogii]
MQSLHLFSQQQQQQQQRRQQEQQRQQQQYDNNSIHSLLMTAAATTSATSPLDNHLNRGTGNGSSPHPRPPPSANPTNRRAGQFHAGSDAALSALLLSNLSRTLGTVRRPAPPPPTVAALRATLADLASRLSAARAAGSSEPVVAATDGELRGFFSARRPGRNPLAAAAAASFSPSIISCSSLSVSHRGRRSPTTPDGERTASPRDRAVLHMAVPFYTTPDTVAVTPKTVLANFAGSMEELIDARWRSEVSSLFVGAAGGSEGLLELLAPGYRPVHLAAVVTRFEPMKDGDGDGADPPASSSSSSSYTTSIRLRFRAALDVRIHDRSETVEVTAPVALSGRFESPSSTDDRDHDARDLRLEAVDLDFDCLRLLEGMIARAAELVRAAVVEAFQTAPSSRASASSRARAAHSVSPPGGAAAVADGRSSVAGSGLFAGPAPNDDASPDSDAAWTTRAAALLGMGSFPSAKTLGTLDTLHSHVSGSSDGSHGSGDTRKTGGSHRGDDGNDNDIFKDLGGSSGSLSSDTFQLALAALSRSHRSRSGLGYSGVASGATLASFSSSSALAGDRNWKGDNKSNNLEDLAVSDLTKSYLGSILSLASLGGTSSNSNSLISLKNLEHFSFGSFLPSCSSSLNVRGRAVSGRGTHTNNNNNNNKHRNHNGRNEFLALSRRLGLKP